LALEVKWPMNIADHSSTSPSAASSDLKCRRFSFWSSRLFQSFSLTVATRSPFFARIRLLSATAPSTIGPAVSSWSIGRISDKAPSMSMWTYPSVEDRFLKAATSDRRPKLVRWLVCTWPSRRPFTAAEMSDRTFSEHRLQSRRFSL